MPGRRSSRPWAPRNSPMTRINIRAAPTAVPESRQITQGDPSAVQFRGRCNTGEGGGPGGRSCTVTQLQGTWERCPVPRAELIDHADSLATRGYMRSPAPLHVAAPAAHPPSTRRQTGWHFASGSNGAQIVLQLHHIQLFGQEMSRLEIPIRHASSPGSRLALVRIFNGQLSTAS